MTHHFFAVPSLDPVAAQDELNAFCQRHRVVLVERHFVQAGVDSHWAICVQVAQGPGPLPPGLKQRSSVGQGAAVDQLAKIYGAFPLVCDADISKPPTESFKFQLYAGRCFALLRGNRGLPGFPQEP